MNAVAAAAAVAVARESGRQLVNLGGMGMRAVGKYWQEATAGGGAGGSESRVGGRQEEAFGDRSVGARAIAVPIVASPGAGGSCSSGVGSAGSAGSGGDERMLRRQQSTSSGVTSEEDNAGGQQDSGYGGTVSDEKKKHNVVKHHNVKCPHYCSI